LWGGWELNPQGVLAPGDFKSPAFASSATAPKTPPYYITGFLFERGGRAQSGDAGYLAVVRPNYHPDGQLRLSVPVAKIVPETKADRFL
jgi:hypothetical protein